MERESFKLVCGAAAAVFIAAGVGKWIVQRLQVNQTDVYDQWLVEMREMPIS